MDRINVNLPPSLHARLKALAVRLGEPNIASLIRRAISELLERNGG